MLLDPHLSKSFPRFKQKVVFIPDICWLDPKTPKLLVDSIRLSFCQWFPPLLGRLHFNSHVWVGWIPHWEWIPHPPFIHPSHMKSFLSLCSGLLPVAPERVTALGTKYWMVHILKIHWICGLKEMTQYPLANWGDLKDILDLFQTMCIGIGISFFWAKLYSSNSPTWNVCPCWDRYPLVNVYITMENHHAING